MSWSDDLFIKNTTQPTPHVPPCPLGPLADDTCPACHWSQWPSQPPLTPCSAIWACPRKASVRCLRALRVGAESGSGRARVDPCGAVCPARWATYCLTSRLESRCPWKGHALPGRSPALHWRAQQPRHQPLTALTACPRPLPQASSPGHLGWATTSTGQQYGPRGPLNRVPQRWAQPMPRAFTCPQDIQTHQTIRGH